MLEFATAAVTVIAGPFIGYYTMELIAVVFDWLTR